MKYRLLIALSVFLIKGYAQENAPFDGHNYKAPYFLDTPQHWGIERFQIPIQFAPSIAYKGVEDIRFTPGWAKKDSEEYWSYVFLWDLDGAAGALMQVIFWSGWVLVLLSTFMISHFHLFGLKQVHQNLRGEQLTDPRFDARVLYRYMRHPIMAGFFLAFWGAPRMTVGHLLLAVATTGYILVALQFEERDLVRAFGAKYQQYQREVRMFLPSRKTP